jgi:hypothetical protein
MVNIRDQEVEIAMSVLMLNCPTTGREFSTGIYVEAESFLRLPDTVTKSACPHCGLLHNWWTPGSAFGQSGGGGEARRLGASRVASTPPVIGRMISLLWNAKYRWRSFAVQEGQRPGDSLRATRRRGCARPKIANGACAHQETRGRKPERSNS